MVTIDDIAGVVTDEIQAATGFAESLPGGVWFERAPDTPSAYPYAVFHLATDPAELLFESAYLQKFTLTIAGYVPQGVESSPADPPGVQQFLFAALASDAANALFKAGILRNATERILHAVPKVPSGKYAQQLRDGRDVFLCGLTTQFLVQGDRSVV